MYIKYDMYNISPYNQYKRYKVIYGSKQPFLSNFSCKSTTCKSFSEFTRNVIEDVDTKFVATANIVSKIRRELKAWKLRSIGWRTTVLEKKVIPESSTFVLKSSLTELWKILEKAGIEIALLMLDDLHYLAEKYPDGLYDLRGIFQALPNQGCNYILCVAGKRELFTEIRELAEPLSRFFNIKHTLIPFNLMETEIAIKKPIEKAKVNLKLDNEVISQIFKLTSGHPYFIHFIMRELVSEKSGRINISDFEESYKKIEKLIGRDKFDVDFSIASEREREILLAAAKLDLTTFTPSDIKIKDARTKMSSLRKKNLIIKRNRGEYAIYHPLFKEYLRKRKVK